MNIKQNRKDKLLVICGPTATGKTALGFTLSNKFGGSIISADSRQVYAGLDIGTGKDIPIDAKRNKIGGVVYYEAGGVRTYGYDIVGPKEDFSVSLYIGFFRKALRQILNEGKLPIVVGGTGLYIKAIVDGIPTIDVPRNNNLRDKIAKLSVDELYENLCKLDPLKAASLNYSDKKNPRRLIRAVEVAQYLVDHPQPGPKSGMLKNFDVLMLGLTAPKQVLEERVNLRVDSRIKKGFSDEVVELIKRGVEWSDQSMISLGYRQWRDYLEGGVDLETVISEWKKEERSYVKRQMVWWKKDKRINWFDISEGEYVKKVEYMVQKWYYSR